MFETFWKYMKSERGEVGEPTEEETETEDPTIPTEEDFAGFSRSAPSQEKPSTEEEDKDDESPESEEEESETVEDEAPAPESQDQDKQLFLGKFKLTGDREKDLAVIGEAYKNLESAFGQSQSARKRAEDLLGEAIKRAPEKQDKPTEPKQKTRDIVALIAKAALEDEGVDDDVLANKLAEVLVEKIVLHPTASAAMLQTIHGVGTHVSARETLRKSFYEANPELVDVPEWALRKIATEVQEQVSSSPEVEGLNGAQFAQRVLEETAERARKVFGRVKGKQEAKPREVKKIPSGVRSESRKASKRPPDEPQLTDQQKEMQDLLR